MVQGMLPGRNRSTLRVQQVEKLLFDGTELRGRLERGVPFGKS